MIDTIWAWYVNWNLTVWQYLMAHETLGKIGLFTSLACVLIGLPVAIWLMMPDIKKWIKALQKN